MWWGLFYQVWNHISLGEDTQRCIALITYFKIGFRLVTKLCPTLCDPMDCSTPEFPVLCYLPDFVQIHVHWVGDAIHLSHPLHPLLHLPSIFPTSGSFAMSQLFAQVAKVLELHLQHQSFQCIFRVDFLQNCLVWSFCKKIQGTLRSLLQHYNLIVRAQLKNGSRFCPLHLVEF